MRHVFLGHHALAVREASQSLLDDYAVLVAVHYVCVNSRADLQVFEHAQQGTFFENVPRKVRQAIRSAIRQPSHSRKNTSAISFSGQVIALGKQVRSLRAGDYVACATRDLHYPTDIICVSEHTTVRLSSSKHLRLASLVGPATLALQSVRESGLQFGESVCVVGLDLVGHLAVQLFKRAGCQVYAVDAPARFESATITCSGADEAYACLNETTEREILVSTHNHGVDATLMTMEIKNEETMDRLVRLTRSDGKMVFVGLSESVTLPALVQNKGIDCIAVNSYGAEPYAPHYQDQGSEYPTTHLRWTSQRNMHLFAQLLEKNALILDQLVGPEDIAIETITRLHMVHDRAFHPGAIIRYQPDDILVLQDRLCITPTKKASDYGAVPRAATSDHIRVGIVGVGSFAQTKLLPILARMKGIKLTALVDANSTHALNVAPLYTIENVFIHDEQLFASDKVDAVVIASPHKFHCDQIIRAMNYGKAVFVEKPMVTDRAQLERLMPFLYTHAHIPFCVDYSRSYAPFIRKIKEEVARRKTPLIIHYRVNAGFIPKEHWMQTDVGAGRLIGDACHIIDLLCYLVDCRPVSVSVEALHATAENLFPTDNFSAQISFEDGSLCSLVYTALGHDNMGRERMELFFDAKSIIMDDYEYLAGFGMSKLFDETATVPDKGYEALLSHFCNLLLHKESQPFLSFERLYQSASLTLLIDQLACEGGGASTLEKQPMVYTSPNPRHYTTP